jgi:DNA polymerase delta subunit 1
MQTYNFQHLDTQPCSSGICLFGRTTDGLSIAAKIGDIRPHITVAKPENYESWKRTFVKHLKLYHSSKKCFNAKSKKNKIPNPFFCTPDIGTFSIESGQDICNYNEHSITQFVKIECNNTWELQSVKDLLINPIRKVYKLPPLDEEGLEILSKKKTVTEHEVSAWSYEEMTPDLSSMQVYNDQVDYTLQWLIDNDIYSCGFLKITGIPVEDSETTCDIEINAIAVPTTIEQEGMVDWVVLSYDIETLPKVRNEHGAIDFPEPEKDPIITIGVVLQKGKVMLQYVWVLSPGEDFDTLESLGEEEYKPEDSTVFSFKDEKDMLQDFIRFIIDEDVDFIEGHNICRYDNDYLVRRYSKLFHKNPVLGRFKGKKSFIKKKMFQSNQKGSHAIFNMNLPGRVIFDSYDIMKNQHNEGSYKLDNLAEKYLGTKKVDMPYEDIPKCYQTKEGRHKLAVYCLKDSWLVRKMMHKLCKITVFVQMSNVTGISIKDVLERGQGIRTISLMLRYAKNRGVRIFIPKQEQKKRYNKRNIIINGHMKTIEEEAEDSFEGAVVVDPMPGHYKDPVICLDFASLYPSIMQALNMSYETLVDRHTINTMGWKEGEEVRTIPDYEMVNGKLKTTINPNNPAFVTTKVRLGLLPEILQTVLTERRKVKKKMKSSIPHSTEYNVLDGTQLALKVVANSIYGFTGATKGFLSEKRIAGSVTKFGRGMILTTKSYIENHEIWGKKHNIKCIYGDTDSVFVHLPPSFIDGDNIIEKSHKVGETMAQEITKLFLPPNDLEYEKAYKPFLLIKKKRYSGMKFEPGLPAKLHIKGLESVRRDFAPILVEAQKKILHLLLIEEDVDKLKDYVRQVVHDLHTNKIPLEKLTMSKKLSRPPEEYKSIAAHVSLAMRLAKENPILAPVSGDRVPYLIYRGPGNQSTRACTPDEAREGKYIVDRGYYLDKQLKTPLLRLLKFVMDMKTAESLFRSSFIVKDSVHASNMMHRFVKGRSKRKFNLSAADKVKKFKVSELSKYFS